MYGKWKYKYIVKITSVVELNQKNLIDFLKIGFA